ncbi:3-phosphoshikimate 1-carboxyvinyltransferase [Candidatus Woesearchaeota archaeon]|nr:3-phosphoshikimate 1-carboxyvinyltransferase [Candidatus Woesearchaeota archaeon]
MRIISNKTKRLDGDVTIPASKSHTIRALLFATLADGESVIKNPLNSSDAMSCKSACQMLGAKIDQRSDEVWVIEGIAGNPKVPDDIIDVGNSGTTLRLCSGMAALCDGTTTLTGDHQIRKRPILPLLESLNNLGAECYTAHGNSSPPIVIKGKLKGGHTEVEGITSQYLSSLLANTPFAEQDSHIVPKNLHEKPYVEMTLSWLDKLGLKYKRDGYKEFHIEGGQKLNGFKQQVPGDFSSATFPLVAASMINSEVRLYGLDINDSQGDKKVIEYLKEMGSDIQVNTKYIEVRGGNLKGGEFDLNDTPDALPAMAVAGCAASGTTRLINVPQARIKETDRITTMTTELSKMGANVSELEDGMVIGCSKLRGTVVESHDDHRIAMAMSLAGMIADGQTIVNEAECINVTFPNYIELMKKLGSNIEMKK